MKNLDEAVRALKRKYQIVTGRAGHSWSSQFGPIDTLVDFGYCKVDRTYTDFHNISTRGSCALQTVLNSPFLVNPLVTAWELLTYSFVIDWFVNIGQLLQAMHAGLVATNQTASSGFSYEFHRVCQVEAVWWRQQSPPYTSYSGTFSAHLEQWVKYQVRIPGTVSYLPQIRVNLTDMKVLDLVALICSRFNLWRYKWPQ
jgi:hypothetical protein